MITLKKWRKEERDAVNVDIAAAMRGVVGWEVVERGASKREGA
jgi:hypothetical protein